VYAVFRFIAHCVKKKFFVGYVLTVNKHSLLIQVNKSSKGKKFWQQKRTANFIIFLNRWWQCCVECMWYLKRFCHHHHAAKSFGVVVWKQRLLVNNYKENRIRAHIYMEENWDDQILLLLLVFFCFLIFEKGEGCYGGEKSRATDLNNKRIKDGERRDSCWFSFILFCTYCCISYLRRGTHFSLTFKVNWFLYY